MGREERENDEQSKEKTAPELKLSEAAVEHKQATTKQKKQAYL